MAPRLGFRLAAAAVIVLSVSAADPMSSTTRIYTLGGRVVPGPLPPNPYGADPALDTQIDLAYGPDAKQKLDFAKPAVCRGQIVPLIIYIHGGGWTSGDKSGIFYRGDAKMLLQLGFAIAAVNYRLAPGFRHPAQIQDCKLAVRWLRAHAVTLGIDPDRLAAWGESAGGHLVSILATADDDDGLEGPGLEGISSRLAGVVEYFGPTDLTDIASDTTPEGIGYLTAYLGCSPYACTDKAREASPITYVTPDDPPILILHGDRDSLVPYRQGRIFGEALRLSGTAPALVKVLNAEHAFLPYATGAVIKPSFEGIAFLMTAHLARTVEPALRGDLNMDGRRNHKDLLALAAASGTRGVGPGGQETTELWNPLADIKRDGVIDGQDLNAFLQLQGAAINLK